MSCIKTKNKLRSRIPQANYTESYSEAFPSEALSASW
jgi:hypothetical protein